MKMFYEPCVQHAVNHFKEFEVKPKTQMHPQANMCVCCLHSFVFSGFLLLFISFWFRYQNIPLEKC